MRRWSSPRLVSPAAAIALSTLIAGAARAADYGPSDDGERDASGQRLVSMLPPTPEAHMRNPGLVVGGVFVELVALGATVGGPFMVWLGSAQVGCDGPGGCGPRQDPWVAPLGGVLISLGIAGMGAGVVMMVYGAKDEVPEAQPSPQAARRPRVQAWLRPSVGGAALELRF